tara:strand:+ start:1760 stop:2020 length:261 start_codon:yes stop_codon:yes gene_type:complete
MKLDKDNMIVVDDDAIGEYLRSIIGFMQMTAKRGFNPQITEQGENITIIIRINDIDNSYTTKRMHFANEDKKQILDLLTNGAEKNE